MSHASDTVASHRSPMAATADLTELIVEAKSNAQPQLSIMIPTFRRPELLRDAIASAINQATRLSYEIVVVDNEQDAEVAKAVDDVVRSFSFPLIKLYRNRKNLGMFGNWNICLQLARAKWVMLLNDDDLLLEGYFSSIEDHVNSNAALIATQKIEFDKRRATSNAPPTPSFKARVRSSTKPRMLGPADFYLANPLGNSSGVLINTSYVTEDRFFDESFFPSSDYHAWLRLVKKGGGVFIKKPLAVYVIGENESLRPEVLTGFLEKDKFLRQEYFGPISSGPWAALIRDLLLWRDVYLYTKKWGIDLSEFAAKAAPRPMWVKVLAKQKVFVNYILPRIFYRVNRKQWDQQ